MSLKLLVFGDLLNLDRACLRCLIASLQSSLYHGLLLVGFVDDDDDDELEFNDASTLLGH